MPLETSLLHVSPLIFVQSHHNNNWVRRRLSNEMLRSTHDMSFISDLNLPEDQRHLNKCHI